jgi:uncharacterized protein (TIGR03790 family)
VITLVLLLLAPAILALPVASEADTGRATQDDSLSRASANITVTSVEFPRALNAYDYSDVLVLINNNSAMSKQVGEYFVDARDVPTGQVAYLDVPAREVINWAQFQDLKDQVRTYIIRNNLVSKINYIVTTKGLPLKIWNSSLYYEASVDEELAMVLGTFESSIGGFWWTVNPYYQDRKYFDRNEEGIYLVNRLTGYDWDDVKGIIDRANHTYGNRGKFVLDVDSTKGYSTGGYGVGNLWLRNARDILVDRGEEVLFDETRWYVTHQEDVMGYASWGSNDANDTDHAKPHNQWVDGSIAETYVSTGGRTFTYPPRYGQSMVADWIAENVTGIKGYVYEPFLTAVAHPDILFERYTAGFNLADSYRMASQYMGWMGVVVGDPKTSPYRDVPDLYIDDTMVVPGNDTPATGDATYLTAVVDNLGGRVENASVTLYIDGQAWVVEDITFDTFSRTTLRIDFDAPPTPDSHHLKVVLNDPLGFFETLYDNNEGSAYIVTQERPVITLTASNYDVMTLDSIGFTIRMEKVPRPISWFYFDFGDGSQRQILQANSTFHSFDQDGEYNVTAWVLDEAMVLSKKANITIIANNRSPLPLITVTPTSVLSGEPYNFDASASSDMDGQVVHVMWDLGDGNTSTEWQVDHAYERPGEYVTRLTVTDDDDAMATVSRRVDVGNRAPVAAFVADSESVWKKRLSSLNASTSWDPDGRVVQYEWDFGDGTEGEVTRSPWVNHVFQIAGDVTVTLTVIDDMGGFNETQGIIEVLNQAPIANLRVDPLDVLTGQLVELDASSSYDEDGELVIFEFRVLDETGQVVDSWSGPSDEVTWEPEDDGVYSVLLTLTDDDFGISTASATVIVHNRPPTLVLDVPTEQMEGTVVEVPASLPLGAVAFDPDGGEVGVAWIDDLSGQVMAQGSSVTVPLDGERPLRIKVVATDDDGAEAVTWVNLTANLPPEAAIQVSLDGESLEDRDVNPRMMLSFDASASSDPGGVDRYQWDFGDGFLQEGVLASHAYGAPGTYTVILKVTDGHGAIDETTFLVTVVEGPTPDTVSISGTTLAALIGIVVAAVIASAMVLWMRGKGEEDQEEGTGD